MSTPAPRRVLVVLGMHRTGTSLLMHALERCGLRMGSGLAGADCWNANGYREIEAVYRTGDAILSLLGRHWKQPAGVLPLPRGWWARPELEPGRRRLATIVARESAGDGLWALKDPRTALLLPLWLRIFQEQGIEPVFVLALRRPEAVAASLRRRDGFPAPQSDLLWMRTYLEAVRSTGARFASVIQYERWFERPREQAERLIADLRAAGVPCAASARDLEPVVRRELRHHAPDRPARSACPAARLHAELAGESIDPGLADRWAPEERERCERWRHGDWESSHYLLHGCDGAETIAATLDGVCGRSLVLPAGSRRQLRIPSGAPGTLELALGLHAGSDARPAGEACSVELTADCSLELRLLLDPTRAPAAPRWHEYRLQLPAAEGPVHRIELTSRSPRAAGNGVPGWVLCREPVFHAESGRGAPAQRAPAARVPLGGPELDPTARAERAQGAGLS